MTVLYLIPRPFSERAGVLDYAPAELHADDGTVAAQVPLGRAQLCLPRAQLQGERRLPKRKISPVPGNHVPLFASLRQWQKNGRITMMA